MIQSARVTRLTPWTQKSLAAWAVKTALMMEHLHPAPRIIPDSECQRLHAAQQPPYGYLVFLSRWNPYIDARRKALVISRTNRVNEFSIGRQRPEEARRQAESFFDGTYTLFHVMFAIGHVGFAVIGHNSPWTLGFNTVPEFANIAQRIWPRDHSLTWPPQRILGDTSPLRDFFSASDRKAEQEPPP